MVIFIDPEVKNYGEYRYYRDVLLGEHLLPEIKELSGSELFRFHHNRLVLLLIEPEKLLINMLLTMLSMNDEGALKHAF